MDEQFYKQKINQYLSNYSLKLSQEEKEIVLNKCMEYESEYMNPSTVVSSILDELNVGNLSIETLKNVDFDTFYDWFNNGRTKGNFLKMNNEEFER